MLRSNTETLLPRGVVPGVLALLVALSSLHCARTSPVPGDQYPTVGLTLGGYTYSVNVTTYANVSADTRDIIRATPNSFGSDFGVFADATAIYTTGKNSFRNQAETPPTYRVAKAVIERNYTSGNPALAEAWYDLAANRFYTDLNRFYLDKYISDPLAGRGEFNKSAGGELASVREPIIDASTLFYPVLYFYHEVDAAWNALKRAAMGINVAANVEGAAAELEDAVGCILAPNVVNGRRNERVAPGYNPWDVSNRLGAHFCTCTKTSLDKHHKNDQGEEISQANRRFFDLAKKLQAIFRGGIPTPEEFGAIRNQMQHVLNINQIQLTLEFADHASECEVVYSCITQFQRGATLDDHCGVISKGAASWAHWRMAMPALWSEVPTDVYKAKLMAIADLLHPTAWARITTKGQLSDHFDAIVGGIRDVVRKAGYHWHDIANCKTGHTEDQYEDQYEDTHRDE